MLRREAEERRSPKVQQAMEQAEFSADAEWMDVIDRLQHRIVRDVMSQNNNSSVTVNDLRQAALRHPEIAFWVKYNRARQGQLNVGDAAPNVPVLRAIDSQVTTLLGTHQSSKPCVVVAGSWS